MTAAAAGMDALRVRRARGLGDRGQFGPAIAELSKAIFLCPDNAALYAERGHHYAELGDLQVRSRPARATRGPATEHPGLTAATVQSCIRNYRKALSLQPEWPELRERLAAAADALVRRVWAALARFLRPDAVHVAPYCAQTRARP